MAKLVRSCRTRCLSEDRTRTRREVPPPPPIPPPPPTTVKRREEANRREAMGALFASVGTVAVFLVMKDTVTSPIDRKPKNEVLETRIKRNEKGQPFVQYSNGDWLLVKPSSRTAGVVYLRDRIGRIYRLTVDDRIQVDVSSDDVMLDVFGDGQWESSIEQLFTKTGNEVLLSEDDFINGT